MELTEGDLIEVENVVLKGYEIQAKEHDGFTRTDRIVRTLTILLGMGRAALASESVSGSSAPSKPYQPIGSRTRILGEQNSR